MSLIGSKRLTVIVAAVVCLSCGLAVEGATIFVKADAAGANNGTSWADAFTQVQPALNAAVGGDEVWVAAGTYVENITLKAGVALYGGLAGDEDPATFDLADRDFQAHRTILDGNQAGSVVTSPSGATSTTRIDGFTIRNGRGGTGGGVYCSSSSPTISNNTITANSASGSGGSAGYGGGIYCYYASPVISNNTITGNTVTSSAYTYGGGIYCYNSSPGISNNMITGNSANGTTAGNGGGVYCVGSSTSPAISNNTITGNSATVGGGVYCYSSSSPTLSNNIVAFNSSGLHNSGGVPVLGNNCVYNPTGPNYSGLSPGAGDISVDPQLLASEYGDVHLKAASPCIDAGLDTVVQSGWVDIDGQPRIQGVLVDIGADEFDGTTPPFTPRVVRVKSSGNDANDGSSWSSAKRTVQAGIDAVAASGGGDVWVAAGTYSQRLTLKTWVHVYGGFAGTESSRDERNWVTNATILDGTLGGSVVTASSLGVASSTIDGFTIRNGTGTVSGSYYHGGGIYCYYSSPVVSNNTITGNSCSYGGGIYCYYSSPVISHNTITGNLAGGTYGCGGGIYCSYSAPTISNNAIAANRATGDSACGAGLYCVSSSPAVSENRVTGNSADGSSDSYGGGIYCHSSASPAIFNNTITGNSATGSKGQGGGIYCCSSSTISNNTIVRNSAYTGGGIRCYSASASPAIVNNLVAFNSSGLSRSDGSGMPTLGNNCVYNPAGANYSGMSPGAGDISVDPQMLASDCGEVHLKAGSPCIDVGDDAVVQPGWTDMDGQARIQGASVDIGADEFDGSTPPFTRKIVRISPLGNDGNDGSTWALAKRTVQAGIDAAAAAGGGDVWVGMGTYNQRITLKMWVHVYGGFAGTEDSRDERDWIANATVLDGSAAGIVVTAPSPGFASSTVDGFTIRNGKPASGSACGIYCFYSSPGILNNKITGNVARGSSSNYGGGVYCYYSSPMICNNIITGNAATNGGGISCCASAPVISNNTISGNSADSGGGIHSYSFSSPVISNNVIAFNSSGLWKSDGTPTLRNNCVYNPPGTDYFNMSPGAGDISLDPQLVASEYGEVHLKTGSPCIDAGEDAVVQPGWVDVDGQPRIQGGHVDIGADEFDGTAPPFTPRVVRVSPSGNDANDGSTWASPKLTVQAGIDAVAAAGGGDVWVAGGTYNQRTALKTWVHVFGGFGGTESSREERNWVANATILDGGAMGSVVTALSIGFASSTIDGFTVRNGTGTQADNGRVGGGIYCYYSSPAISNNTITSSTAGGGGGIYCFSAAPVISNNTISGNNASDGTYGSGGGICCSSSSPTISGNTITGNTATGSYYIRGGGICCFSSSPLISNNTITGNTASGGYGNGGGIFCYLSSPLISNNRIVGNIANGGIESQDTGHGGGICCEHSSPLIFNNTITGNNATGDVGRGGGVYCAYFYSAISNNTIVGNNAAGISASEGGAVHLNYDSSPAISNNIVAFNSSGLFQANASNKATLRYNCVYNPAGSNYSGLSRGTGDISVNPQLLAWDCGDVHLNAGSPCINTGLDSVVQPGWVDMDGQPRIQGGHVDIGADEFDGTTPAFTRTIVRVSPSGNDASDGSTWTSAKRTVQAGIDSVLVAGGGDVWVAAGTYDQRITLKMWVHVYGGFAGTESSRQERNWAANVTILDGGAGGSVVTASLLGFASSTIDGFTIRNGIGTVAGSERYGGGVYCMYSSLKISNNTITENTADGSTYGYGGGIYCYRSSPQVICNNTITRNRASGRTYGHGGGIYSYYTYYSSFPAIYNNTIAGNTASSTYNGWGGGMCFHSTDSVYPYLCNNNITGNVASHKGGGIHCTLHLAVMLNNTITGNTAPSGGGIWCSSSPIIANTIVAFNSSGIDVPSLGTLRHNNVFGNTAYNYSRVGDQTGTNGNISVDPFFIGDAGPGQDGQWGTSDDDYGDLRLQATSPCIDAGDNAYAPADRTDLDADGNITEPIPFDLDGHARFMNDPATTDCRWAPGACGTAPIVDMGAYEYIAGDFDRDGDIDPDDLDAFGACASGPAVGYPAGCAKADFDADGDVDQTDFGFIQRCHGGENGAVGPDCGN